MGFYQGEYFFIFEFDSRFHELIYLLRFFHECIMIMGLVTHGCVKATCLGARQLGYDVTLVQDGHSSFSKDAGRMIDKWNRKLAAQDCDLITASQVTFDS